jgi:hypothetical protein
MSSLILSRNMPRASSKQLCRLLNGKTYVIKNKHRLFFLLSLVLFFIYFSRASIVGKEVLPPPELEKVFGLTGGNTLHLPIFIEDEAQDLTVF